MFGRRKNRSSSVGSSRSGSAHCRTCGAIHLDSDCAASENPPQTASTSQRTEGTMAVQNDGDLQVAHSPTKAATFKEGKEMKVTSQDYPRLKEKLNKEVDNLCSEYNFLIPLKPKERSLDHLQDLMKALKRKRQKLDRILDHLIANEGHSDFYSQEKKSFHDKVKEPWDYLDLMRREKGIEDGSSFYSSVSASPSNSSGASDTEMKLAEAEAQKFRTEKLAKVKEAEIEAETKLRKLQIDKEVIDQQTKVRYLEQQLAAERNSQTGSYVYDWINNQTVGPKKVNLDDVSRKIGEFGVDATKNWLRVSGKTDSQVEEILGELGFGLGRLRSPKSSILAHRNSKTYGKFEEKAVAREEDGLWPGSTVRWRTTASVPSGGQHLASQMDSTARFLLRKDLLTPNQGADIFKGDKSKFLSWINRLMRECDELSLPAADRISVLRVRTEGKARKVIDLLDDCSYGEPGKALDAIIKTLYQRFGSGPEIADDIRKKLENLTPIKASDNPEKIQELADLTTQIAFNMKQVPELADLNTATGLSKIRKNLPYDLQRRWITAGSKYKDRSINEEHPPFTYFSEWLNDEAKKICDPHFRIEYLQNKSQKDQKKDKGGKSNKVLKTEKKEDDSKGQKVLKTEKTEAKKTTIDRENKQGKPDKKEERNCIFHPKGVHSLKDCRFVQGMPEKEKEALTKWAKDPLGKSGTSSQQ